MFYLRFSKYYKQKIKKVIGKDKVLFNKVSQALDLLRQDPFDRKLRTHKVDKFWSSRVTHDIRVIWVFNKKKGRIILLLNIGGHSGRKKVY